VGSGESLGTIRTHSDLGISMWTHQTTSHGIFEKIFCYLLHIFGNVCPNNPKSKKYVIVLSKTKVVTPGSLCRMQ